MAVPNSYTGVDFPIQHLIGRPTRQGPAYALRIDLPLLCGFLFLVLSSFYCSDVCELLLRVNSDLTAFRASDLLYFTLLASYLSCMNRLYIIEFVYSLYGLSEERTERFKEILIRRNIINYCL
jgi:hypothetical protein